MRIRCNPCKKLAAVLLILGLCSCMLFTGCSSKEKKNAKEKESGEEKKTEDVSKYDDIAGVYQAEISMTEDQSVLLYLQISEDGSFVFARDDKFASTEKGAGHLGKTEEGDEAFLYEIVNGNEVDASEYTATYTVDDNENIQFTSPMWFGSTSPKMIHEDESVTYPCFVNVKFIMENAEEEQPGDTEEAPEDTVAAEEPTDVAATTMPDHTPAIPAQTTAEPIAAESVITEPVVTEPAAPQSAFIEGTYQGSIEKFVDAMNSTIRYDVTVTFQNGSYSYTVNITLSGGMEYSGQENYSGSYSVNGASMSMTGTLSGGVIYGTSITLNGTLSSYAGQQESITVFQ